MYVAESLTGLVVAYDKRSAVRVQHVQTGAHTLQGLALHAPTVDPWTDRVRLGVEAHHHHARAAAAQAGRDCEAVWPWCR